MPQGRGPHLPGGLTVLRGGQGVVGAPLHRARLLEGQGAANVHPPSHVTNQSCGNQICGLQNQMGYVFKASEVGKIDDTTGYYNREGNASTFFNWQI